MIVAEHGDIKNLPKNVRRNLNNLTLDFDKESTCQILFT